MHAEITVDAFGHFERIDRPKLSELQKAFRRIPGYVQPPDPPCELIEIATRMALAARNPEAELVQKALGNPLIAAALARRDEARIR